ncbi:MAG: hypothetical protein LJI21_00710 [Wolbachia endosymbiont of Menacanthus eurysternus]|nr:MAG: hypothetical protein LJI21_00710 [Wolbachia endosymbiont of Menacanthus eurysternus]
MATITKTASKNNLVQNQKVKQKTYKSKYVKPVRYIDRDLHVDYMSAEYENGNIVQDENNNPIKWKAI